MSEVAPLPEQPGAPRARRASGWPAAHKALLGCGGCLVVVVVGQLLFLALIFGRLGGEARPGDDRWPHDLPAVVSGDAAARELRVYKPTGSYFLRDEYRWSCRATPEELDAIVAEAGLQPLARDQVPMQFFRFSGVDFWRPGQVRGPASFFVAPGFDADGNVPDGTHTLLMYDVSGGRIYAWTHYCF